LGHHGASNTADLVIAGNHVELTKHDDADAKLFVETRRKAAPSLRRKLKNHSAMTGPIQNALREKKKKKNITSPTATTRSRQQASC
jgi:hypothetical protein